LDCLESLRSCASSPPPSLCVARSSMICLIVTTERPLWLRRMNKENRQMDPDWLLDPVSSSVFREGNANHTERVHESETRSGGGRRLNSSPNRVSSF